MRILIFIASFLLVHNVYAQTKSSYEQFGKINTTDLQKKVYTIDSNANAVALSDIGSLTIIGNKKGSLSSIFKRHKVIHILNKSGYNEANIEITLYTDGANEESLDKLKAVTYNLENGKIVETKLEKDNVFTEKIDKRRILTKFTMPQVKEGSIIELEYQITSDFISNPDPWYFQSTRIPQLWSQFTFSAPEFFSYNMIYSGYHPFFINEQKNRMGDFYIYDSKHAGRATERYRIIAGVTDFKWAMRDVPALPTEIYTSSIKNHISRIELQLAAQNEPLEPKKFQTTWPELTKNLLESESFGKELNAPNHWLSELKPVFSGIDNNLDKAKAIYKYVRDNFICTGNANYIFIDHPLRDILKTKKGSVSEINLFLTCLLRYADLDAKPVILSTKEHGYALDKLPISSKFNYVIVQLKENDQTYYLDASDPLLGFNKLLSNCYNGHARVVDEMATKLNFAADTLEESKTTEIQISKNGSGKWAGKIEYSPGYFESHEIRKIIKAKSKEEYLKLLKQNMDPDIRIINSTIEFLEAYEKSVRVNYEIELNIPNQDLVYINPFLFEKYEKNMFNPAKRYYPVEMPYPLNESIVFKIEIPNNYVVDELPSPVKEELGPSGKGLFEYNLTKDNNIISLDAKISVDKTFFSPNEYYHLRNFFALIVNKQSEQIVLRKK